MSRPPGRTWPRNHWILLWGASFAFVAAWAVSAQFRPALHGRLLSSLASGLWTYPVAIRTGPADLVTAFLSWCILSFAWALQRNGSRRASRRLLAALLLSIPASLLAATGLARILGLPTQEFAGPSALSGSALAMMLARGPSPMRRQWIAVASAHTICHGFGSTGSFLLLVAGAASGILSMWGVRTLRMLARRVRLWILGLEIRRDAGVRDRVEGLLSRIAQKGMESLSRAERGFLHRASLRYRNIPRETPDSSQSGTAGPTPDEKRSLREAPSRLRKRK